METTSIEPRLKEWLATVELVESDIIVISRLSKNFEDAAIVHIEEKLALKPLHLFSYHLSLDHAASSVLSGERSFRDFEDLASHRRLIFLHDIEDVSNIRRFAGGIRGNLEKGARSTVVLIMRPAATYKVYKGSRAPLYGRVIQIEEPDLGELGIRTQEAAESGLLDLYKAYAHDAFNKERATEKPESASFNLLNLLWHILINDSRKAGSVRVVASCVAYHDKPLTNAEINQKCGIEHGRQAVHAAIKTGLMKMTEDTPRRSHIYPPLLKTWIRKNVPFYPS